MEETEDRTNYLKTTCTPMKYEDLLQRADEDDYGRFTGALAYIFVIDPLIIAQIANLDYLWRPNIKDKAVNYIQWLTCDNVMRDPIEEVLCYLFCKKDSCYNEPYEFNLTELKRRADHKLKIIREHGNMDEYFKCVSLRLWKKEGFIEENYGYFTERARKGY